MIDYPYTPLYYSGPIQVRYYDKKTEQFIGGIGYHDFIINGITGEEIVIENVIHDAEQAGIDFEHAIVELSWLAISDVIMNK